MEVELERVVKSYWVYDDCETYTVIVMETFNPEQVSYEVYGEDKEVPDEMREKLIEAVKTVLIKGQEKRVDEGDTDA